MRMFSIKGDNILDPFAGLGTTLRVANRLGRNAIGYEIDDEIVNFVREHFNDIVIKP